MPWGCSLDAVRREHGQPLEVEPEFDAIAYHYNDTLFGLPVTKRFLVRNRVGLINGNYTTDVDLDEGVKAYADIVVALLGRYPGCDQEVDDGGFYAKLTDPTGEASIMIGFDLDNGHLWLGYNGPGMYEWAVARHAAESDERAVDVKRKL
jgi:hypothetical protein